MAGGMCFKTEPKLCESGLCRHIQILCRHIQILCRNIRCLCRNIQMVALNYLVL